MRRYDYTLSIINSALGGWNRCYHSSFLACSCLLCGSTAGVAHRIMNRISAPGALSDAPHQLHLHQPWRLGLMYYIQSLTQ